MIDGTSDGSIVDSEHVESELTLEDLHALVIRSLTELHRYLDGITDSDRKIKETTSAIDSLHKVHAAFERFAEKVCPADIFPDREGRWPSLFGAGAGEEEI